MGARILVIDDNAKDLELATRLLQGAGHAVLTAQDGESGIAIAQRERLDLIVSDIGLPGMGGMEIARRIRRNGGLSRVPLVAYTGHADPGDRELILAAGFDGYVPKSHSPGALVQIEAFLPPGLRGASRGKASDTPA